MIHSMSLSVFAVDGVITRCISIGSYESLLMKSSHSETVEPRKEHCQDLILDTAMTPTVLERVSECDSRIAFFEPRPEITQSEV